MKRQLLLISVLLLTMYVSSYGQNFPGAKPKGKIRSIIILHYNTKDSSNFNKEGQMTDSHHYNYSRNRDYTITYLDTSKTINIYNKKGQMTECYRYSYSNLGSNKVDLNTSKTINVYNKEGQLAKQIYHAKKGQFVINYSYFKTDSGLVQRRDEIGMGDVKPWGYNDIRFNKSGKKVYQKNHTNDSNYDKEYNYSYNKNGYFAEYTFADKKRTMKTSYEYNEDGDVTAEQDEDRTGTARYKYKYTKYDELHNWLVQYSASNFSQKIERIITYYK